MSNKKFENPIAKREPIPEPVADGEPGSDDVEGHMLPIDPTTARMLQRAREDDVRRQAEKHRREHEAKPPFQPRSRP